MDCQGVNRLESRADRFRTPGGPCLLPLKDVSFRPTKMAEILLEQVTGPERDNSKNLDFAKP